MNAPLLRRGACPTLRAPMQTGDGLLARLYPVDGGLTPAQLIGLADAARRHGSGILEITQRGSFQIRGLMPDSTPLLAAEVDALGISVRDGVPVETGSLAGLDPDEIADPRPLAEAIRAGIAARGLAMRLGPKVTVVVDGVGRSGLVGLKADVRVEAERSRATWRVSVPTRDGTMEAMGLDQAEASAAVVAVLEVIAARGRQARATALSGRDISFVLAFPRSNVKQGPPSGLPVISPSRGEIGKSGDSASLATDRPNRAYPFESGVASLAVAEAEAAEAISPLEGEMAGRPEGGHPVLALSDGRVAVFAALPFGHIAASELRGFAAAVDAAGAAEFRTAPHRRLIALCPSADVAEAVLEIARGAGLVVDANDPRTRIAACPGAPLCASGHIPARDLAGRIAAALPAALDLHISGCAKRCAKPNHDGLTLLGTPDGAALALDGANGSSTLAHVAKERAEAAIGRVAALIAAERRPGESGTAAARRIDAGRLAEAFVREA